MLRMMFFAACLSLAAQACSKSAPTTVTPAATDDPLAGKTVVPNVEAKAGDVTICPYSGRKFLVTDDSPRWAYEGKTYVFCSDKAVTEVQKDPPKYLADFAG